MRDGRLARVGRSASGESELLRRRPLGSRRQNPAAEAVAPGPSRAGDRPLPLFQERPQLFLFRFEALFHRPYLIRILYLLLSSDG